MAEPQVPDQFTEPRVLVTVTSGMKPQTVSNVSIRSATWGDRTFKVLDPNGCEIWFYTNVAESTPPQGAKLV